MKNYRMRYLMPIHVAILALLGLVLTSQEGGAQDFRQFVKKTYFVEVQKHFFHWTSGGESYYWVTILETDSREEAELIYAILRDELENGGLEYMNSSGPTSVTTVVDIRLRIEYEYPQLIYSPYNYNFQIRK